METKASNRSYIIWLLKVVATLMVLYIHGANIFTYSGLKMPVCFRPFSLLANTGVPLFMIISGFLFFRKEVDWKENLYKKTKRLAIPFLIWSGFWIGFEAIGFLFFPDKFDNVFSEGVLGFFIQWTGIPFVRGPLYGPLWYVRELYIISIAAPIIQKPLRKWPELLGGLGIVLWLLPINSMFRQTVVLFVLGGTLSVKKKWIEKLKQLNWKSGILVLLTGAAISFVQKDLFYQLTLALNVTGAFILGSNSIKNENVRRFSYETSKYIFLIYCIHGKPLSIAQIIYTGIIKSQALVYVGYFALPMLCFCVCLFIAYAFRKFFPSIYRVCTGE